MTRFIPNIFVLTLTICIVSSESMAQLVQSPIVYYKFDETTGTVAADSSGNGVNATIKGNATWTDGYFGGAINLTGQDNNNIVLPVGGLDLYSDKGSFAAWIFAGSGRIRTVWAGGDNTTGGGFGPENEMHLVLELPENNVWVGGELTFYAHSNEAKKSMFFIWSDTAKGYSNPAVPPVNPTVVDDGKWHHIISTWGDGYAKMFIDGQLSSSIAYNPTTSPYKLTNFVIGSMINGVRGYIGKLDEVKIYNGALSAGEAQQLFKNEFYVGQYAPTSISLDQSEVEEKQAIGTVVGTFQTQDADLPNDNFTYTLVAGENDNDQFEIVDGKLETKVEFSVGVNTDYTINVKVTDAYGFSFEQELVITVTDSEDVDVLNNEEIKAFSVYPNPTSEELSLNMPNLELESIGIISLDGKLQNVRIYNENAQLKINVSSLQKGIYIIQFRKGSETFTQRFLKQ